jgi:hypothetical protein
MRLINLMTIVCALLLLALIPAFLQFGRAVGVNASASLATVAAVGFLAVLAFRQR